MDKGIAAGQGAIGGAAAGAEIGGPWGAAGGAVLGGALGYFGAGDDKGYSIPWDQYYARLGQIRDYSTQLEGATTAYASAINNMYNTAYNQWLPNAAAKFASRGLNIDSGAFGAEAGRTATGLIAQGDADVARMRISNIDKVNSSMDNAWSGLFGAANASNKAGWENSNANVAGLLGTEAQLARYGMSRNQNPGSPAPTIPNPVPGSYDSSTPSNSLGLRQYLSGEFGE